MNLRYIFASGYFRALKSIKLNWPFLLSSTVSPMSLLFVVWILSSGADLPFALVGGLVSMVTIMCISEAGGIAWFRFDIKYVDLIITTLTSPIDFMFGEIAGTLVWAVPGFIIYIALDSYFHLLTAFAFGMTVIVLFLVLIAVSSIAFWLSGVVKHSRHIWAFVGLASLLMTILPPTFYSYTLLPKPILYVLAIFPTTPAAVLEQGFFGIAPMNWYMLGILAAETIVYFLIAKHLTRWREN